MEDMGFLKMGIPKTMDGNGFQYENRGLILDDVAVPPGLHMFTSISKLPHGRV